jgi:hypothetical protein
MQLVGWPGRHGRIVRGTVQHATIVIRGYMTTIDNRPVWVVCGTFVRGMCAFGIGKSVWRLRDLIRFCGGYCTRSAFAYLHEVASWRKFFTRVLKAVWDFIWFYLKRIGNHFVNR